MVTPDPHTLASLLRRHLVLLTFGLAILVVPRYRLFLEVL